MRALRFGVAHLHFHREAVLHLSHVAIKNFRNLVEVEVKLGPGLNVIVGENNIGKTNVLDAIRVALGAGAAGEQVRLTREDRHRRADGTYEPAPIQVDLTFDGLTRDDCVEFVEILHFNAVDALRSTASIHFEWSWSDATSRYSFRRWGGPRPNADSPVPEDVLQSIPVTLLGALRDALSALAPGRRSRLGALLKESAKPEEKKSLEELAKEANAKLDANGLVKRVEESIGRNLRAASGPQLSQAVVVRSSEPEFEKIVNNLRLALRERGASAADEGLSELRENGLGYNNLLYMATVLAELDATKEAALPLLLVEEPEAHLHPQLQTLLADFLTSVTPKVQTIVTSHSPTIAAHVDPKQIRVLHRRPDKRATCVPINDCGLAEREIRQLRRMLDVTKATLLFSRGILLVEGISEALLVPVLARRLGKNLEQAGVSVVPIAGVDFGTIGRLFGDGKLQMPTAIMTDGDPGEDYPTAAKVWRDAVPKRDASGFLICTRLQSLRTDFATNTRVKVFHSKVTLEYDLADAAMTNGPIVFDAWRSCHERRPRLLKREDLLAKGTAEDRALSLWRAVCLAEPTHGKAELAQALAELLDAKQDGAYTIKADDFVVPPYIVQAIDHACSGV